MNMVGMQKNGKIFVIDLIFFRVKLLFTKVKWWFATKAAVNES